ncbi:MAG: Hydroxyacylglutathione hydrolase [Pseudomonadota bacterium]
MSPSWRFCPEPHPQVLAIPAFSDNYLWLLLSADGTSAAVVDPGDAAPVEAAIERLGLRLVAIVLTHHHPDHVGGVATLKARHGARVHGPATEAIDGVDEHVREGDRVEIRELGIALEVIDVPGHTRGHVAYFAKRFGEDPRPLLFCGDTLFAGGCGRLFEGTPAQMLASLDKLAALPGETLVHCAHEYTLSNLRFAAAVEPGCADVADRLAEAQRRRDADLATVPSRLGDELATNPFLRTALPAVVDMARERLGRAPASQAECFSAIREWKNVYR